MRRSRLFDSIPWVIALVCAAAIARESWRKVQAGRRPAPGPPPPQRPLHPSVQSWYSPACQNFYKNDSKGETRMHALDSGPSAAATVVAEDGFFLGRALATDQPHPANEVVVSTQHRFVYVEVRKAASSTVRRILARHFNATWRCPAAAAARRPKCGAFGRCSTLCLPPDELDGYLFFSFVRGPLARFYSGYKQATSQRAIKKLTLGHMTGVLEGAMASGYYWDPHLETQALSLSSPVVRAAGGPVSVPLHFLGRTEAFEADFTELMDILRARSEARGVPFPHLTAADVNVTVNGGGLRTARARRVGDAGVEALVRRAYAQDYTCFGY